MDDRGRLVRIEPQVRQSIEKNIERRLQLHARQVLADTDMRAVAEGQRALLFAKNVELVRIRPDGVVAIGGMTLDRAAEVVMAGATAVAVITDLLATDDPESRVRAYLRQLAK